MTTSIKTESAPEVHTNGDSNAVCKTEPNREKQHVKPPVDMYKRKDGVTLVVDLPGVNKKDLEVTVEDEVLTVEGKAETGPEADGSWLWREFLPARYRCRFQLSREIDVANIKAEMQHGTLSLSLPFAEAALPRQIEVRSA